jgi:PAS domain S-box-containing protein
MGNGAIVSSFATTYNAAAHDVASVANSIVLRNDSFSSLFHSVSHIDEDRNDLFNDKITEVNSKLLSCFSCHDYCMKSVDLRNAFVAYIRNYAWLMDISNDPFQITKTVPYSNTNGTISFHQYIVSIQTNSIKNEDENHVVHLINKMSIIQQLKINDSKDLDSCKSITSSSKLKSCFSRSALVPVIIASLWPLFRETDPFKTITANMNISSKHNSILHTPSRSLKSYSLKEVAKEVEPQDEFPLSPPSPGGTTQAVVAWTQLNMSLHSTHSSFATGAGGSMRTAPFTPFSSSSQSFRMSSKQSLFRPNKSNSLIAPAHPAKGGADTKSKRIKDLFFQAVDDPQLEDRFAETLKTGVWLEDLLASLDDHPYSITVSRQGVAIIESSVTVHSTESSFSSVTSGRLTGGGAGWPLVYVNRAFENLTQYSRQESLGRTCSFLHSEHTERGQVQLVSEALRTNMACKVALVNRRKDGSEFLNLLATQPVYNLHGELIYMVGVQYDVTKKDASIKEIKLVDDLLRMVANILK